MKKSYLALIVLFVLLLLGGFYFLNTRKTPQSSSNRTETTVQPTTQKESISDKISGKLTDLIMSGKSLTCTYSSEDKGTKTEGSMYIQGKNVRGTVVITTPDQPKMTSDYLIADNTMYSWIDGETKGFKLAVKDTDLTDTSKTDESENVQQYKDMTNKYDYNCLPWIPDQSKFEVPQNIEFLDMAEITKSMGGNSATGTDLCSSCNFVQTETDKATCRAQFNCE